MWEKVKKETGRWKSRWKIRDLFADPRCSQAILGFLASTQVVGRRVPTPEEEEEDAQSEASEWDLREREERNEERRQRDAAMGEEAERLLFFPLPFLSASTGNEDIGDEA